MWNMKNFIKLYGNVILLKLNQYFLILMLIKTVADVVQPQQPLFYIHSANGNQGVLNIASSIIPTYHNHLINANVQATINTNTENYAEVLNQPQSLPYIPQKSAEMAEHTCKPNETNNRSYRDDNHICDTKCK